MKGLSFFKVFICAKLATCQTLPEKSHFFVKAQVGHQDPTTGDFLEFRRMNEKVMATTLWVLVMMTVMVAVLAISF